MQINVMAAYDDDMIRKKQNGSNSIANSHGTATKINLIFMSFREKEGASHVQNFKTRHHPHP